MPLGLSGDWGRTGEEEKKAFPQGVQGLIEEMGSHKETCPSNTEQYTQLGQGKHFMAQSRERWDFAALEAG